MDNGARDGRRGSEVAQVGFAVSAPGARFSASDYRVNMRKCRAAS